MFYRVRNHAVYRKNIKLTEGTPDMTKVRNHAFIGIIRIIRRIYIPADLQQMKFSNTTRMSELSIKIIKSATNEISNTNKYLSLNGDIILSFKTFIPGITKNYSLVSYTEIGRHIINQSNNVIYEDRKNQVYGIG